MKNWFFLKNKKRGWQQEKLLLGLILAIAFLARAYGFNWDSGYHLHPDERMIVMVVDRIHWPTPGESFFKADSPLNPQFFAYGSLPVYLLKIIGEVMAQAVDPKWSTYDWLPYVGRALNILFDLGSVFLIFKIGRKLFGKKIALTGAFFYATAVLPVQLAHFYTVDIPLNFFILLTLNNLLLFYQRANLKTALKVGMGLGMALATKASATVLFLPLAIVFALDLGVIWQRIKRESKNWRWRLMAFFASKATGVKGAKTVFGRHLIWATAATITAGAVFVIWEPFALIDYANFSKQLAEQARMTKDASVFPYTLQYLKTLPYFYYLKNLLFWGLGMVVGGAGIAGIVLSVKDICRQKKWLKKPEKEAKELIFLAFGAVYFLIVGRFAVKFMRYWLPLYPFFCLYAAQWLGIKKQKILKRSSDFFKPIAIIQTVWLLSFLSIYSRPNTRVSATEWILTNIPTDSILATEHWDDRLPLKGTERYKFAEMPLYEADNSAEKWQTIAKNLNEADYLILASNRLWKPLPRLADCQSQPCYPKTARYYESLFAGRLGFEMVAAFSSFPQTPILGLEIKDTAADESFTVYDHPQVFIFKKEPFRR